VNISKTDLDIDKR